MNARCEQGESALVSRSREYIGLVDAHSELSHLSEAEVEEESLIAALTAMSLAGNPVELEAVRPGSGVSHPGGLGRERVRTKFESSPLFEDDPDLTAIEIARCGTAEETRLYWLAREAEPPEVDTELIGHIHRGWFHSTYPQVAGEIHELAAICEEWNKCRERHMQGERDHQVRAAVSLANELAVRVRERYPNHVRMIFSLRNYALMIGGVDRLVALKDQTRYLNAWSEEPDGLDELLLEALIDDRRRRVSRHDG